MSSLAIIIQARMTSTRLPGKVLQTIVGRPMLWYVVERSRQARLAKIVAVATSDQPADDAIERFCREHKVNCFRGSLDDVLDRYYQAARGLQAGAVIRVTADCPLIDPDVLDQVIARFNCGDVDYVSNSVERSFPDGLDCEAFSFAALQRAWREAAWKSEREHVTPYLYKHPELFRLASVRSETDLSDFRWTVDDPRDLEFVQAIVERLGPDCRMRDILNLLEHAPEVRGINSGIRANEGYEKSLREDG